VLATGFDEGLVDGIKPAAKPGGSIPFIAPEQLDGSTRGDPRSDLYSLGVTAYALLTGRPPFVQAS
jgi:serine/threonine protein kinase